MYKVSFFSIKIDLNNDGLIDFSVTNFVDEKKGFVYGNYVVITGSLVAPPAVLLLEGPPTRNGNQISSQVVFENLVIIHFEN